MGGVGESDGSGIENYSEVLSSEGVKTEISLLCMTMSKAVDRSVHMVTDSQYGGEDRTG